ncbi:MAG: hypothetical protein ACWA5U_09640 [bacterium]
MQLANEDNLRINVLLAQKPYAIRINESTMTLYALTARGDATIQLNPTAKDEQYLRWVRELLSMKVTGSPGGYPVFMKRWTRMGHTHNTLEHMLLLGEPEAIVAVAYAPQITHEIARRAWWAYPTTDIARHLLEHADVVAGELGKELAEYLLEFLPFEERQLDIVDSVRLCLQGSLVDETTRLGLWKRAKRKNPYYVGFMHGDPQLIPDAQTANQHYAELQTLCAALENNPYAAQLLKALSQTGQKWLETLKQALHKPVDQDVVISLLQALDHFFPLPLADYRGVREVSLAEARAKQACEQPDKLNDPALQALVTCLKQPQNNNANEHLALLEALLFLGQLGEDSLIVFFGGNDSVGSVMRRRLQPLTTRVIARVECLMA